MKTIKSILISMLLLGSFATVATEKNTDWIYCMITDDYHSAAYFTGIFHGNYDQLEHYQDAFFQHISSKYGKDIDHKFYCTYEANKADTVSQFKTQVADSKDYYDDIVITDWKK